MRLLIYKVDVEETWNEGENRWMATSRFSWTGKDGGVLVLVEHRYHSDRDKAQAKAVAAMLERIAKSIRTESEVYG